MKQSLSKSDYFFDPSKSYSLSTGRFFKVTDTPVIMDSSTSMYVVPLNKIPSNVRESPGVTSTKSPTKISLCGA